MLAGKCSVADPFSHDALCNITRFLSEETTKEFHVARKDELGRKMDKSNKVPSQQESV